MKLLTNTISFFLHVLISTSSLHYVYLRGRRKICRAGFARAGVPSRSKMYRTSATCEIHFVLHRLVEREQLIAENYFLASANTIFRPKTTKNLEELVFSKNPTFSKCAKFSAFVFLQAFEHIFFRFSIKN
jgi:hypothetical protein